MLYRRGSEYALLVALWCVLGILKYHCVRTNMSSHDKLEYLKLRQERLNNCVQYTL